jgi:hypothetical protein
MNVRGLVNGEETGVDLARGVPETLRSSKN